MKLSRFDLIMIIAFVLVGVAGGVGYYFTSSNLDDAQKLAKEAGAKAQALRGQAIFPDAQDVKILADDIRVTQTALDDLTRTRLNPPGNPLAKVGPSDPTAWKQTELNPKVQEIETLARNKGVELPKNFYLGFSRYVRASPALKESTVVLEKQLIGLSQLTSTLIDSGVSDITSLKRTMDEDGSEMGVDAEESIHGRTTEGGHGFYRVYPFEVSFVCGPEAFRNFLNALETSPSLFVIRWVRINNSQPVSPRLDDLAKISGAPGEASVSPARSSGTEGKARGPVFIFGGEKLNIVARLDLIEWLTSPKGGKK